MVETKKAKSMASHARVHLEIAITSPADFHVHLRQGALSRLVYVRKGGFNLAYVMVV